MCLMGLSVFLRGRMVSDMNREDELQGIIDFQNKEIEQLKIENEKFKLALQDISNTEDSRKAAGVGFDVTINVIAKIALGDI